jgi:hypothetical protein
VVENVVLKFKSLGHLVMIYGSLAKSRLGLYWVCLNENRFVPTINLSNSDSIDSISEVNWLPVLETVFCFQNSKTCFWYQRARLGCCF